MRGLLVVSAETADFLWPAEGEKGVVEQRSFCFGVVARATASGGVELGPLPTHPPPDGSNPETVERLGAYLATWEDEDLLSFLLRCFFAIVATELPSEARGMTYRLYFPPWMPPRKRSLLREAAATAGLSVLEGLERGLAPALTAAALGAENATGWLVADRCGTDLDLYVVDQEHRGSRLELSLSSYRRCSGLFSRYYTDREGEAAREAERALTALQRQGPVLTTDLETARLLRSAVRMTRKVETETFAQHLASRLDLTANRETDVSRRWQYWLDYGDDRLVALLSGGESFPYQVERLFEMPQPPPQQLYLGIRAGFAPIRSETHEVCDLILSRPHDYFAAPGHLLVCASFVAADKGELSVEVLQHGNTEPVVRKAKFP